MGLLGGHGGDMVVYVLIGGDAQVVVGAGHIECAAELAQPLLHTDGRHSSLGILVPAFFDSGRNLL